MQCSVVDAMGTFHEKIWEMWASRLLGQGGGKELKAEGHQGGKSGKHESMGGSAAIAEA